jgi:transcriptional regulator with XRE-family HTH domain
MARRRENPEANRVRGERLKAIRDALGLSQYDIVPLLNAAAEALGLPASYRYYTVSRNESGSISFEDAAVWLSIAPASLPVSWEWFVLGEAKKEALTESELADESRALEDLADKMDWQAASDQKGTRPERARKDKPIRARRSSGR